MRRIDTPSGRRYETPAGLFPSITTILSATADKTQLNKWKERVGHEEAARISKQATDRGTLLHLYMETAWGVKLGTHTKAQLADVQKRVDADPPETKAMVDSLYYETLSKIRVMHVTERPLYHPFLKVAGTCDGIVSWGDSHWDYSPEEYDAPVLAVLDYKTSRKWKDERYMVDMFLQGTFYALAANVVMGTTIDHVVIAQAIEGGLSQIVVKPIHPYIGPLLRRIDQWYALQEAKKTEATAIEARLYGEAA